MPDVAVFSASEIFDIAIETEQLGQAFYAAAAASVEDRQVHALLEWLGCAEKGHEKLLHNMRNAIVPSEPIANWGAERHEFISHLVYSRFMPNAEDAATVVAGKNADEILRLALNFEKDTIIFLYEMRDMVPESGIEQVNFIIDEEKKHVSRISNALANLK